MSDPVAPEISLLLCTRNRPRDVQRCVPTILENSFTNYELLIVDQSDGEDTFQYLQSLGDPRIRIIRTETRGLARARNIAIRNARTSIVAFTDDDCICDREWVGNLVQQFRENPDISGLFGKVLAWGDRFGEGMFCHCLIPDDNERVVNRTVPPHKYLGHGNNMAFRIDLYRQVGLYNPAMGAGTRLKSGEDTDLTFRALRRGCAIKYSPAPLVYHNNWITLDTASRMDLGYVLGFVMVFGKFALCGDPVAIQCLRERLGELVFKDLKESRQYRDWKRYRKTLHKIGYYFLGFFPALYFRLKGDLRWEGGA